MKKILLCIITLSACLNDVVGQIVEASFSQEEKKQFIHKGLLRAQATISPGIMLKERASTISIHGNLEYYVADNISIRGDSYYFLKDDQNIFSADHSVFSGASYHFKTKNRFDPYFALEPGIAIVKRISFSGVIECLTTPCPGYVNISGQTSVNPLISPALGFNLYFQKLFHLFGEVRYISGKYLSNATTPLSLNELRFSFGLGWNLNLIKQQANAEQ